MLLICFSLMLFTLAAGVVLVILNRRDLKRSVRILGVAVFIMLMEGIYPYYHGQAYAVGLTLAEDVRSVLNMPVAIKIANQLHGSAFSVVEREE